jgi:hypothetical protein
MCYICKISLQFLKQIFKPYILFPYISIKTKNIPFFWFLVKK